MGWAGAAGEIPQRLPLHSPRSTQVSVSPLLQVCNFFVPHVNIILILPISAGFNMGGAGRGYPFYDPISFQRQSQVCFNTVKKCLYIQNFNCSKFFLSIQSLNLLKVELKRLDFIQLASPPLVGSPNSHAQRLVEQRFGKSRLILTFSKTFPCRLGSSRRRRART